MSFLKYEDEYRHQRMSRGGAHFGRAHLDGMPFRGPVPPLLHEREYEACTERVDDGHVKLFDLSRPEDAAKLEEIVDKAANHWYQVLCFKEKMVEQPDGSVRVYVFCVWSEPWKELAKGRSASAGHV